jgi:hypothetical protein
METQNLGQLILYVVSQADELGGYTTTIRLHKFLYLIDLEHQRRLGRTLTGLEWTFYHYGPYATTLARVGERLGYDLEREEFVSSTGAEGRLFRVHEPQDFPEGLGFVAEALVNDILSVWADQNTADLLDYVYHETEPMKEAHRGEKLDFTIVPRGSRYYEFSLPSLPADVIDKMRASLQSYAAEAAEEFVELQTSHDAAFAEGMRELDEAEAHLKNVVPINIQIDPSILQDTLPSED